MIWLNPLCMSKPPHVWFCVRLIIHTPRWFSFRTSVMRAFGHLLRNRSHSPLSGRHNGSAGGLQSNLPLYITISPLTQTWRPSSCPLGTKTEPEVQASIQTSICFASTKILRLSFLFFFPIRACLLNMQAWKWHFFRLGFSRAPWKSNLMEIIHIHFLNAFDFVQSVCFLW